MIQIYFSKIAFDNYEFRYRELQKLLFLCEFLIDNKVIVTSTHFRKQEAKELASKLILWILNPKIFN